MKYFFTAVLLSLSMIVFCQDKFLKMSGKVIDSKTSKKLKNVVFNIITTQGVKHEVNYKSGKYKFYLKPNERYKIYVNVAGYKSKSFEVDAQNISKYYGSKNYISDVDVTLDLLSNTNKDKYQPKIGVLKFNKEVEGFEWDLKFSEKEKFQNNLEFGDSSLINQPPKIPTFMSQLMVYDFSSTSAKSVELKKAKMSQVFNGVIAGMLATQSGFYANNGKTKEAVKQWNSFQVISGRQLNTSSGLEDLYANFNTYNKFSDTMILVRLGEWMELSQLSFQTEGKFKQKSIYLNYLSTFLIRLDTKNYRDAELSFIADLSNLLDPIKEFSRLNEMGGNKEKKLAMLQAQEKVLKEKLDEVMNNFYEQN